MRQISTHGHGNHCSCRFLARAVGCDPKTIRFDYCRHVLMKRWRVECNHGCFDEKPAIAADEKWHDIGPIDPVKAILLGNE